MRTCVHHGEEIEAGVYRCTSSAGFLGAFCHADCPADETGPCFTPLPAPKAPKKILVTPCPGCGGSRAVYKEVQRSDAMGEWLLPDWLLVCPACQDDERIRVGAFAEEADSGLIYAPAEKAEVEE